MLTRAIFPHMRIASLVPSATEMLFALGLGDQVVAVTHECDFPPEAASRPHLTRTVIPEGLAAGEIDAAVRAEVGAGRHLYELDEEVLRSLDVGPDRTQAVCDVCAVSYDDVRVVAARLPSRPEVISLDPVRLGDVISDVTRLGEAAGAGDAAATLRSHLESRLDAVREAVAGAPRPRVLALEWLDPVFIGGHWVPEMIEIAGGEDALGEAGAKSRTADWDQVRGRRSRGRGRDAVRMGLGAGTRGGAGALRQRRRTRRRARVRGRRSGLVLAAGTAPGGGHGIARPPAAPEQG